MSTGTLGGLLVLTLVAAFAHFATRVPDGGPAVHGLFFWLAPMFRFASVKRDFFVLLAILALAFLFMFTWELRRRLRPVALLAALATLVGAWSAGAGNLAGVTHFEVALGLGGLILILMWLPAALKGPPRRAPWRWVLTTSFGRWLSGLIAFTMVLLVAFTHPYYGGVYFENWRIGCALFFSVYVALGLPYAVMTNLAGASLADNMRDPGFVLALLFRSLTRHGWRHFLVALRNRRTGILLRDLMVKLFFVPLMLVFFFGNCSNFLRYLRGGMTDFNQFYQIAYWGIFVTDVSLSLIGYLGTLRWLGNKSVSVDASMSGWMVALMCYPPFNCVTDSYLPYTRNMGAPWLQPLNPWLDVGFKLMVLVLMGTYAWATMAFGCRFSNLSNRGIVTRGPYAVIRHPAYICKNLAWWAESLRSMGSGWQVLFLAGWNIIYLLRAYTEERHLLRDPDYQAYCNIVRYRFIPGLI